MLAVRENGMLIYVALKKNYLFVKRITGNIIYLKFDKRNYKLSPFNEKIVPERCRSTIAQKRYVFV